MAEKNAGARDYLRLRLIQRQLDRGYFPQKVAAYFFAPTQVYDRTAFTIYKDPRGKK